MCPIVCVIIVLAVLVSIYYLHLEERKDVEMPLAESWKNPESFRLEYEQLSEGLRSRDSMTIIAGTILITASILLLATTVELKSRSIIDSKIETLMILASVMIYSIWLICLNLTTKKLNNLYYERLRKMEESCIGKKEEKSLENMKCGIHHFIRSQTECKWWYKYFLKHIRIFLMDAGLKE